MRLLYRPGVVVLVAVLYTLGLLPVAALGLAAVRVQRAYMALCRDLDQIAGLMRGRATFEEIKAVREPQSNDLMLWYTPEVVERAILQATLEDLKGPSVLAALGVVCAAAGSLLSLLLP